MLLFILSPISIYCYVQINDRYISKTVMHYIDENLDKGKISIVDIQMQEV